ncbi:MAG TPA: hypothetical protein VFR22_03885 [Nocardioidaceae bacterium]|nr:hypothetical protein [Nocardioidaceae bacterium]
MNRWLRTSEDAVYYSDYLQDLAAAIAQDRSEAGEHRRPGPAKTAGRHGSRGGLNRWAPSAVGALTILSILYAVLARHFGFVEALWIFGLAVGLAIAIAAVTAVGMFALAGRKVKR